MVQNQWWRWLEKKFRGVDLDVGPRLQLAVVVDHLVGGIGGIEETEKNIKAIGIKGEGEEVGVVRQVPLQVGKKEEEEKKREKEKGKGKEKEKGKKEEIEN